MAPGLLRGLARPIKSSTRPGENFYRRPSCGYCGRYSVETGLLTSSINAINNFRCAADLPSARRTHASPPTKIIVDMSEFTHLHLHTEYSLLDGACDVKKLVRARRRARSEIRRHDRSRQHLRCSALLQRRQGEGGQADPRLRTLRVQGRRSSRGNAERPVQPPAGAGAKTKRATATSSASRPRPSCMASIASRASARNTLQKTPKA